MRSGNMYRPLYVVLVLIAIATCTIAQGKKAQGNRSDSLPPAKPPLEPVDVTKLPEGTGQWDIYLLMGQSNMKGRGLMPEEPKRDARIVMMHLRDNQWYLARHPLHLTGDARTFEGHDNAGVGPGLAFAEAMLEKHPKTAIALVPCAVGGTSIQVWQKGARRYEEALQRARLALETTATVKGRIAGVLWLQGEADAHPEERAQHEQRLLQLVDDLRADLDVPDLPFVACTIGEMSDEQEQLANQKAMNEILLAFPFKRARTGCVDARDIKTHIGDRVHFDTAAQEEIGRRFAEWMSGL